MRFARSEFTYLFLSGRDPDVRELLKLQTASGYLDKRYVTPYFQQNHTDICENLQGLLRREPVRTAWIYWAQGMQRAPYIVQKCVDSAQRAFRAKGWEVKILDLETVKRYVSLPAYVWDKYKAGTIKDAHLSDLIRVCLLTGRGGCWVDATVFFTGGLPEYVYSRELFAYRGDMRNNRYSNISNWMIYSINDHPLLTAVRDILLRYWEKEEILIQYFAFHLVFKLVTDHFAEYWETLPVFSNVPPHVMQYRLLKPYSETEYRDICSMSAVHKLYWRIPDHAPENSFYQKMFSK